MPEKSGQCIIQLMKRLKDSEDFPHEIGLFLGYPPEDVRGFIDNHARNCKYLGFWKVYGDVEKAKKIFAKYERCTEVYRRKWSMGASLPSLIIG